MTVFEDGEPKKSEYRKFAIKTVQGANDFAMMEEVLRRRFARSMPTPDSEKVVEIRDGEQVLVDPYEEERWPLPDLVVIDGGAGQVGRAHKIMDEYKLDIPVVGLAKGPDRKQDVPVYDAADHELARLVHMHKKILQHVRDEAHRFAVGYHRKVRARKFLEKK
jgi:excinuclease ABC subunit C